MFLGIHRLAWRILLIVMAFAAVMIAVFLLAVYWLGPGFTRMTWIVIGISLIMGLRYYWSLGRVATKMLQEMDARFEIERQDLIKQRGDLKEAIREYFNTHSLENGKYKVNYRLIGD